LKLQAIAEKTAKKFLGDTFCRTLYNIRDVCRLREAS